MSHVPRTVSERFSVPAGWPSLERKHSAIAWARTAAVETQFPIARRLSMR